MENDRVLLYKALGLPGHNVDQRDIIKAYLLGKKNFPDWDDQLDYAFAVLSDPRLKSVYDLEGRSGLNAAWCETRLNSILNSLGHVWKQHVATMQTGASSTASAWPDVECGKDECTWMAAKMTMVSATLPQQESRQEHVNLLTPATVLKRFYNHTTTQSIEKQLLNPSLNTQDSAQINGSAVQSTVNEQQSFSSRSTRAKSALRDAEKFENQTLHLQKLSKQDPELSKDEVYKQTSVESKSKTRQIEENKFSVEQARDGDSISNQQPQSHKSTDFSSKMTPGPRDKVIISQLVSWPKNFPSTAWKSNL